MELQQDGPILLESEFQQFRGKLVRPHCFLVYHYFHRCGNLLLRGLDPEGTRDCLLRQPLRYVGIEHVGFRVQNERKNRTHLSRIFPLSRSSLPPSSRTHCDSTFFVSSSCTDLMFWKNPCWSPMRNCFSNPMTWRSKKRTTAALRTLFSQLHAFLMALRSCASLVSILRRCHAVCTASVAARTIRQSTVEFYLLAFSRFPLRKKEPKFWRQKSNSRLPH